MKMKRENIFMWFFCLFILLSPCSVLAQKVVDEGKFVFEITSETEKTAKIVGFNVPTVNLPVNPHIVKIPSSVSKEVNGHYTSYMVTEITGDVFPTKEEIKEQYYTRTVDVSAYYGTLIIPSTIKSVEGFKNSSLFKYIFVISEDDIKGKECLQARKATYAIDSGLFPNTSQLVSVVSGVKTIYSGEQPHFLYSIGWPKTTVVEPSKGNYASTAGNFETYFDVTLELDRDVCGYGPLDLSGRYGNTIEFRQKINYSILPATLSVAINDVEREYGEDRPYFTYSSVSGFVNGESLESTSSSIILSANATEHSNCGKYAITASIDNSNYQCEGRGILTINKAPLKMHVCDISKTYGDVNPEFKIFYEGFKLSDDEETAFFQKPVFTTTATEKSGIGKYPVTASDGLSQNYEIIENTSGMLTVTKAPLTLAVNDVTRKYGEENPTFSFSLYGLRNSDGESCLDRQPVYNCTTNKATPCGAYEIIPSNADAKNYDIVYQKGKLTIDKAPLTVSVSDYTRTYGTDNPDFDVAYSGFVNNEDESVLGKRADVTCSADRSSDVGTYTICASGCDAQNYFVGKYNNGTLEIIKANQNITWNQDLSNVRHSSQVALEAQSSSGLPVTYEMSPNNVAMLYNNNGVWYLDCFGNGNVNVRAVQNGDRNHNAAPMVSKNLVVRDEDVDPSNPTIYLNIERAGTLPSLIAANRKFQIKTLCLTGELNGTDINFLREMSGCDGNGNSTMGVLETLDISRCAIVSGGNAYYGIHQTENNVVGDYMFYKCGSLVQVKLPSEITTIGDYALADCKRLSVISIPNTVGALGRESFCNDISLTRVHLPEGLSSIGERAFEGCKGIAEMYLPSTLRFIADAVFDGCANLSQINVETGNAYFTSDEGALYTSDFDRLLIFPVNYGSWAYTIHEGTNSIAPCAFKNADRIAHVVIPSSMSEIGKDAFKGCINLTMLEVKATTPPHCENDCFEAVSKTRCELKVPVGCYGSYWIAPVWSDFNKIKETDFVNGLNGAEYDDISVYVEESDIIVTGVPRGVFVSVFQANGTRMCEIQSEGKNVSCHVQSSGVYIVSVQGRVLKLYVGM